jgi:hypothetical protein
MIAFVDGLPVVRFPEGEVAAFREEWLTRALSDAARRAGYPEWWLAEHVARSVTEYLSGGFGENVLDVQRLAIAVREILEVIGYGDVGPHFRPEPPPVAISLLDLAREAGAGFELAFFDLLSQRLRHNLSKGARELRLHGLERCVKHLSTKRVWSRHCDALRVEIVSFVRDQIDAVAPREVAVTVA